MSLRSNRQEIFDPPSQNLGEQAHERIVDMVLSGELPAGTVLYERKLAEVLDISRTPVREALMRMDAEGLVRRDPGRGVVVRQIHESEMMELLHVRGILEAEAAALAIERLSDEEIADLRSAVEKLMARDSVSVQEHASVDDRLHGTIAEGSGNQTLARIVRDLRRKTRFFNTERLPDRFHPGIQEHLAILDALRDRDTLGARNAMAQHIENARQGILDKIQFFGSNR